MKNRMKPLSILLLLPFFCLSGKAFTLSDKAEISILTCSPGTELYSLFGHTAIRIHDAENRYDQVFNYGTFDFQTPHFYLKYAQGLLPYQLTNTPFSHFIQAYVIEGRSVFSQRLRLDSLQRQRLFDLLLENSRKENRSYLYNFLFDNCTTRSRDILQKSIPEEIAWNMADTDKSFWNLLDEYLQASPWVQWGIHTILGQRGNRQASPFQYMFLPDYLLSGLRTAQINGERLAEDAETLYYAPTPENATPWYLTPLFVFAAGTLSLIFLCHKSRNRKLLNGLTVVFFLFSGIVGCLIVFLGGFTAHPITAPNWNILWANPLNLIVLWFLLRKNIPRIVFLYLNLYTVLLLIAVPVWIFAQPAVPFASVSFIVLMLYLTLQQRKKYTPAGIRLSTAIKIQKKSQQTL